LIQSNDENKPTDTDESHFNLMQMTERALSSFNNSPLFTVRKENVFLNKIEELFF
jgi:hypothetical protein